MTTLRIENLSKWFGGFRALNDVSLMIDPCERHAIVGPNGAGKTTLFNIIDGQLKPSSGRISLDGKDVTGFKPPQMCVRKVGRTFQKNNLFPGLTVEQNVRLAVHAQCDFGKRLFLSPARKCKVEEDTRKILEQVDLAGHGEKLVGDMAYGEQRQLELAIALATQPEILLLDEPTAGMSPAETRAMIAMLHGLAREVTLLIIEHDMDVVFALADRITVLYSGQVLFQGTPEEVAANKRVLEVYLGGGRERTG